MKRKAYLNFKILLLFAALGSCSESKDEDVEEDTSVFFEVPEMVQVLDYEDHLMEPFLSRDGTLLFFNNLNDPAVNTNLHWATKISNTLFQYQGEISQVNTPDLEGVPSMDENGNFFYVYTGDYEQTLSTIYQGVFNNGSVENVSLVEGVSRLSSGWVNFDMEISADGQSMYLVDGLFDGNGGPHESNLVLAHKNGQQFERSPNSDEIMQNINTDALEYAAAISLDQLELCFTRANENSVPNLYVAFRKSTDEPFSSVRKIENIDGFVEGATYNLDDTGIYFHKKTGDLFSLYYSKRTVE